MCETSLIANWTEPCVVVLNTCIMKGQTVADFTPLDKTSGYIGVVWVLTFSVGSEVLKVGDRQETLMNYNS